MKNQIFISFEKSEAKIQAQPASQEFFRRPELLITLFGVRGQLKYVKIAKVIKLNSW
jgi:hypothetical protein